MFGDNSCNATCCSCLLIGCRGLGCCGDRCVSCWARSGAESIFQRSRFQFVLTLCCTAVSLILNTHQEHLLQHIQLSWQILKKQQEQVLTSVCVSSSPSSRVRAASCLDLCSRRFTYRIGLDRASITSTGDTKTDFSTEL